MDQAFITMPKGFKANGVCADLKGNGALDVGLVVSDVPANIAGVYTSNLVKGHSLTRSIKVINKGGKVRAMIVNAKNANAGVGPVGEEDAQKVAEAVASELGVTADEVITASTGVIGIRLPYEKIVAKVPELVSGLSSSEEAGHKSELAMMTTDTQPKEVAATITLKNGTEVTIAAMAKGSGMIHPNLATMISEFTTDADIAPELLHKMLKEAVSHTFNRVTVDGDTSVCDMVVIMANGVSGAVIEEGTEDAALFQEAFTSLALDLSKMIASDGEGATKFVEIEVFGARDEYDAYLIVSSIAKSPLCKTAIYGMDANWGRIATAAGYSGAKFDPNNLSISLCGVQMCKDGVSLEFSEEEMAELLKAHDINVKVELKEGDAYDRMFTCDYSHDYITINGSYRS
ncbi:MAG: bifunctional glutamate N-acetyltransferase/amino-acid acetyltransferase ArgJ [Saccharofermentans sp.]|nr:bifunctional glutamate N-acetyltransferase/amino-acid acetyltransferase ArgJ [Saccharofermentans sp.]